MHEIKVCCGGKCKKNFSEDIRNKCLRFKKENNLSDNELMIVETGCLGLCSQGPAVVVNGETLTMMDSNKIADKLNDLFPNLKGNASQKLNKKEYQLDSLVKLLDL